MRWLAHYLFYSSTYTSFRRTYWGTTLFFSALWERTFGPPKSKLFFTTNDKERRLDSGLEPGP